MSYKLHNRHTEEDWALHIEEGGFGVWTCAEMYTCTDARHCTLRKIAYCWHTGFGHRHQRTRLEGLLKVIKVKHKSGSWHSADASYHLTT